MRDSGLQTNESEEEKWSSSIPMEPFWISTRVTSKTIKPTEVEPLKTIPAICFKLNKDSKKRERIQGALSMDVYKILAAFSLQMEINSLECLRTVDQMATEKFITKIL